ncbi:MAG TPA: hypothetical protein VFM69_00945 [Pricia sp.]|nr:hypothetical protein [Pricia sp.]
MTSTQNQGIEVYQNLGKLFYAVAMADGRVHIKELDRLKEIVTEKWLAVDDIEDRYHTDAAYQIETVFDWLLEYEKDSEECFEEFTDFYQSHSALFPDPVKNLIKETAHAIANSLAGMNKSELVLLVKIDLLLGGNSNS